MKFDVAKQTLFGKSLIFCALVAFVLYNPFTSGECKAEVQKETKEVQDEHGDKHEEDHQQGDEHDEAQQHTDEHDEDEEEAVKISAAEMEEFGIVVQTAGPDIIHTHTDLLGEVKPDPSKIAHMVPRFEGVVKKVFKAIGDKVKKGEKIAVIESNESLQKYNLTSAIDGTVIDMHLTPGELVSGDSAHEITVANLETVWAELSVYQKDLSTITAGQTASISAGYGDSVIEGKISYVSPMVDEATRTATARVALDNRSGKWKPGMFVTAKVFTLGKKVHLAVAKNAIQIFEGQSVVFVQDSEGFRPQPVTVGIQNDKTVEILSGLHAGQQYIAKGAFAIKAEILKGSFGGGHNH
jgi:cobalt-zinc-cadmium efflux system membrane fusion protein